MILLFVPFFIAFLVVSKFVNDINNAYFGQNLIKTTAYEKISLLCSFAIDDAAGYC